MICLFTVRFGKMLAYCAITLMEEISYHANGYKYDKGYIEIVNLNHMVVKASTNLHD